MAERKAWEIALAQSHYTLTTINPSFVMGPTLSGRDDAASVVFIRDMLKGKLRTGVPQLRFGCVDVRDVAAAHISALTNPSAPGQRFLCSKVGWGLRALEMKAFGLVAMYVIIHPCPFILITISNIIINIISS